MLTVYTLYIHNSTYINVQKKTPDICKTLKPLATFGTENTQEPHLKDRVLSPWIILRSLLEQMTY